MPDKKLTDEEVCHYCHQDNEGYVKMFGRFYLRKDHFNGWNLYAGKGKPLPIKYCPMCGRPLKIEQTQVNSIQDDFCGVPCEFMEDKINHLQAENERLTIRLRKAEHQLDDSMIMYNTIKSEAYKEFAELLHCQCESIINQPHNENVRPISWKVAYEEFDEKVDNLLKELVGDNNEMQSKE